jgi:hypothetical protein
MGGGSEYTEISELLLNILYASTVREGLSASKILHSAEFPANTKA